MGVLAVQGVDLFEESSFLACQALDLRFVASDSIIELLRTLFRFFVMVLNSFLLCCYDLIEPSFLSLEALH